MVFSSMIFLWIFLPVVLFLYFVSPSKIKNLILLIFSLIFYAWGEPKYVLLMIFSILITYLLGLLIEKYFESKRTRVIILILSILINIGLLAYFKYFNFGIEIINGIFGSNVFDVKSIMLPIGISFYTFQILSYIIDLYWGKITAQKNIINMALYISFFPQLTAGPIIKYKDLENQLSNRKISISDFASGIRRFSYGLAKKVLISNTLGITVDAIFNGSLSDLNTPIVWIGAVAYTLQIYFDFSGYSDMAIGLAKMFGFHFNENFNLPYISKSITEFWRRWHISLSTWFKEYIYIPLGGNRRGSIRTYINLMIVFFVTGLWHGASWNFVCWGIYYGIFLIIERLFLNKYIDKNKYSIVFHCYALIIIVVGWVMFRANGMQSAIKLYEIMFNLNFNETYFITQHIINYQFIFALFVGIAFCGPIQIFVKKIRKNNIKLTNFYCKYLENIVVIILLLLCICELASSSYNPFIYFRF